MSETDVLGHPDLRKVWDALEWNAPAAEWVDLATPVDEPVPTRSRRLGRRGVALVAAVALMLFAGNEAVGVFAARRALADDPAVFQQPIRLDIETIEVTEPWPVGDLSDLTVSEKGIFAHTGASDAASDQWQLSPAGWVDLGLGAFLVSAGETFEGFDYVAGRVNVGGAHDTAVIWRLNPESGAWEAVLTLRGGHIASLTTVDNSLVAVGWEEDETLRTWVSAAGTSWTAGQIEQTDPALLGSGASDGRAGVVVGYQDGSLPLIERRNASIWYGDTAGSLELVETPDLGSLGFGYAIGGFRLSDGIEDVVYRRSGFVAYTGYLQVWDGFEGLTLRPREAWASLVLLSSDGLSWTGDVLTDFAIAQMVPFGDGLLAAAALPPPSDTEVVEVEGVVTEVASAPVNKLYYSDDGLGWREVAGGPELGKPLLATTPDGRVIAIDEWQAEDPEVVTQIHVITAR